VNKNIRKILPVFAVLVLGSSARSEVTQVTLGVRMNCPYGLAA
jgi:hypothetical protein